MALSLAFLTSWMSRSIRTPDQMCFQFLSFVQNKVELIITVPIPVPREKQETNPTIFGSDLEEWVLWQHSVKPRN